MKNTFVGIDFSKLKFDAVLFHEPSNTFSPSQVFENSPSAFPEFVKWVLENTPSPASNILFCGEHTGFYSANLTTLLYNAGFDFWLVPGLQIKLTQGIKRTKTDPMDARKIAEFAHRYHDKAQLYQPKSITLEQLKDLLSYRDRLVENRKILSTSANEMKRVRNNPSTDYIYLESLELILSLTKCIRQCEQRIENLIKDDPSLRTNYQSLTSIIGIGLVNATLLLVATSNFTLFTDPRKFGCYCGVVPFEYKSGTSIHGRTRVSRLANIQIKTKLTLAAQNSIRNDPTMRTYYLRKISEGKNHWLVLNNVKNKLIHRMFALVRDGQTYNTDHQPTMSPTLRQIPTPNMQSTEKINRFQD
jgi:transposase